MECELTELAGVVAACMAGLLAVLACLEQRTINVTNKACESDVWLTVHRNSVWIRKTN